MPCGFCRFKGLPIYIKKMKKIDKYKDLVRELKKKKKLFNMNVSVMPIEVGAIRMVHQGFAKILEELEVSGRMETIPLTLLL